LPTFYDKLLQVPLLNLSVKSIDRIVRSEAMRRFDPTRIGRSLSVSRRNAAYVSSWAIVFIIMSAAQGVGDRHRGQWIPFWQQACQQNSARACRYLAQLHATYCRAASGWSCNELGILLADKRMDRERAVTSIERGCELGFQPACANAARAASTGNWSRGFPPLKELPILLRGSKAPITDRSFASLYSRACEQGWPDSCNRIATAAIR
jgi:TPR repeat protein